MATEIKLPRLGQGMESGTIVKWLKSEGEQVQKGEPLYELDTDKVTQEVEADASGVLLKIAVQEGEVEVGRTIAVIGQEGERVEDEQTPDRVEPDDGGAEMSAEKPAEAPARDAERERGRDASTDFEDAVTQVREPQEQEQASRADGRVKASPLARRIARERGIELSSLRGTGPEGRIVAEDVERAAASPSPTATPAPAALPSAEPEVVQLSQTRKTIARRLTEAWQAPVFQLSITVDMSRALDLREQMVERLPEGGTKPTMNDLLTKLCAAALVKHPAVNAHFAGDAIHRFPSAHVGIAIAAPAGLIVPVIRDADRKTVAEIAATRADLVSRAHAGKLQRSDLEGGTFTISNLGMYGVEQFTAVLNPPQAAILAVGAAEERAVVVDGAVEVRPTMHATLTCDHRAVDGADGAEFLRTLKALLELPGLAL